MKWILKKGQRDLKMIKELSKGCPCKGCLPPKRNTTCHDTCQAYQEWVGNCHNVTKEVRKKTYLYWLTKDERKKQR